MSMVEDFLCQMTRNGREPGQFLYPTFPHFVLANGQAFNPAPLPADLRRFRGKMRECFQNAYHLADAHRELTYVEGFAAYQNSERTGVCPGLHAWCVTAEGIVREPTWKKGIEYFGVAFDFGYVQRTLRNRREFGVIDNYQEEFPLLTGEHEDWRPAERSSPPVRS